MKTCCGELPSSTPPRRPVSSPWLLEFLVQCQMVELMSPLKVKVQ